MYSSIAAVTINTMIPYTVVYSIVVLPYEYLLLPQLALLLLYTMILL